MSRSLLGAGLGATGATLYLKPEILQDWARDVMFGPSARPAGPGGKELEQLQRLVRPPSRRSPLVAALPGLPAKWPRSPCALLTRYRTPLSCTCANRWRTCPASWPPATRAA